MLMPIAPPRKAARRAPILALCTLEESTCSVPWGGTLYGDTCRSGLSVDCCPPFTTIAVQRFCKSPVAPVDLGDNFGHRVPMATPVALMGGVPPGIELKTSVGF